MPSKAVANSSDTFSTIWITYLMKSYGPIRTVTLRPVYRLSSQLDSRGTELRILVMALDSSLEHWSRARLDFSR